MIQISEYVYCDDFINECYMESRQLPNPYYEYPYLIIKNFLSLDECNLIVNDIRQSDEEEKAMVKTTLLNSVVVPSVDEEIRRTSIYKLSEPLEALYMENFLKHQPKIEEFFSMALTTATQLQVLEYKKGDFYIKHADDSSEIVDKQTNATTGFICVAPQRKITTVLFASSHRSQTKQENNASFEGGELLFNYLFDKNKNPVKLRPEAGDMVVFLSNPVFCHEVLPVQSGYRLSLVQWHNAIS